MKISTLLQLSAFASSLTVGLLDVGGVAADTTVQGQAAASSSTTTTVLPPKEAEALFNFYFNAPSPFGKQDKHHKVKESYWVPAAADVAQTETDLFAYTKTTAYAAELKREGVEHWPHPIDVARYSRQYAGVMRGDKKFILINGFAPSGASPFVTAPSHSRNGGSWRDRAILVFDGGPAFFHALYDPTTRQVEYVYFNGFA